MDKENLIELTNKLYKITLLFPKKEPLRYKMREVADEILVFGRGKDFKVLKTFFEVAKWQNWVSFFDLLKIEEEYDKIKGELFSAKVLAENSSLPSSERGRFVLDPRKKKILEILKEKEKIQVWEVKKILPNVSKRTLRRDFDKLLKQDLIERIGQRNETFYRLKK